MKWIASHPIASLIAGIIAIVLIAGGISWFQSTRYDKKRLEYEAQAKQWATERAGLIANAEAKEKQVAELESQLAAFRAAAEQGKRVDDALAAKIDEVSKAAADESARTDAVATCAERAERTCAKLRALKPPIVIDCAEYKRKLCSR